jgi:putative glycosyltransferase (TIGR04372 family)
MSFKRFIRRQIDQIRQGGSYIFFKKVRVALRMVCRLPMFIIAVPAVVVIRLIRPWCLVRCGDLISSRIGHFAGNTELYLCERDAGINVPRQLHLDLWFMQHPICNQQLAKMWKPVLNIWPEWILYPISKVNQLIPGGIMHQVGSTNSDRDVHNLLDRFPPHLKFTAEEEVFGKTKLQAMGIPTSAPFVCLNVRDSAYLNAHMPSGAWDYHNYRDCSIQRFELAAIELADRGYFVIRMGAKVREALVVNHPRIIDYATNGMRSDFMDIYIGAKCSFCVTTHTGFDGIPLIFRRPIVFSNAVPLGYLPTFREQFIVITRHHFSTQMNRELTLQEIFDQGVGYSSHASDYESRGIQLIENSSEEIRDAVLEMHQRLSGNWQPIEDDKTLQNKFWNIFLRKSNDADQRHLLHGEIRSHFGAHFLRNNRAWLQ